jgi:outer membrane protein assembly factor BamB
MTRVNDPRPRLVASGEIALGKPLLAEPASSARAVVLVTTDSHVRALASRDLSPVGAWNLDAALAAPPAAASGMVFVTDLGGGVLALGEGGQRLWSIKLPGRSGIVGSPAVADGAVFLLTRDGALHVRALADGSEIERRELGVLPAGGPFASGNELVVPAGSGTLRLVAEKQDETAPPEKPAKPRDDKSSEAPRTKSP